MEKEPHKKNDEKGKEVSFRKLSKQRSLETPLEHLLNNFSKELNEGARRSADNYGRRSPLNLLGDLDVDENGELENPLS